MSSRPSFRLLIAAAFSLVAGGAAAAPQVVVIGFDGADAELTRQYMEQGLLPNLKALSEEGSFAPLLPTNPPQTPVSWSTFATGLNPGRTEIFDFLKRDPATYTPRFCAFDETHRRPLLAGTNNGWVFAGIGLTAAFVPLLFAFAVKGRRKALLLVAVLVGLAGAGGGYAFGALLLPESVPDPLNNRKGTTFWELATQAGLKARVLRVPLTFPADQLDGLEMISGLGVPDLRGMMGQPTLFTTRHGLSGGQFSIAIVAIDDPAEGPVELKIEGPRDVLFPQPDGGYYGPRLSVPGRLEALGGGRLRIQTGDLSSELAPGEWSPWHAVEFAFNPLLKARGMTRFYNQSQPDGDGRVELLMSPIHFHSDSPGGVAWSGPRNYGPDLSEKLGVFKTMGWAIDTWSVSEGLAPERQSLEDANYTAERFTAVMRSELARDDTDVFVQVFAFTDRIQHIFLRFADPSHPAYDAALAMEFEGAVRESYVRMDRIVGEARALAPKDALFLVLSDHGFAQFRRGVNLNRWLVNHGYMVLKDDPCVRGGDGRRSLDDLFEDASGTFQAVDLSRTKAFALGLGNIYINLAGRESRGIVRPGREYRELVAEISAELEALVDPQTGLRPIAEVHHRDESYEGYDPVLIPDLRASNTVGYRVSWDTALGGVPCEEIQDNLKAWGADHCSLEPSLVKGILFSNRPLDGEDPEMADLAPTILKALGLPAPEHAHGRALLP